jgi:periplasmic copper chaperone A
MNLAMNATSKILATAIVVVSSSASAHVTLEDRQAVVGTAYRAVFVVPHGCSGSATVRLRVQIPEGVIATEAKPTTGWNVETIKGKYADAYDYQGAKLSEGIKEVDWSGGRLPDKTRETFVIETYLTDSLKPNTMLYFPVLQECEQGLSRWIEIPADEADPHEARWPAPGVKLLPKP